MIFYNDVYTVYLQLEYVYLYSTVNCQVGPWLLMLCRMRQPLSFIHFCDVIKGAMACQITCFTIVYSIVYSGAAQRNHNQSPAFLAFMRGIHRWRVNSPHKWAVTGKMIPFDDVAMLAQPVLPLARNPRMHLRSNVNLRVVVNAV